MVFSSILFLLYFLPVFFIGYYLIPSNIKNIYIVAGSLIFYVWGAPLFVFVLLASIITDYLLALQMDKFQGKKRKLYLVVSVVLNVSILMYFKYFNFFIDNLNMINKHFGNELFNLSRVALPIGISFFTFHELSYMIDVYRGVKKPMKKIEDYALYILLFPQLIAGPIIRFNEIADQIKSRNNSQWLVNCHHGLFRFILGLSKKVLIANVLGNEIEHLFQMPDYQIDASIAWTAALGYSLQIYFDFSGYSDMAIGLALMMGFKFPENFNMPYIADSITDFWKRWHMSLSRWMKDYLYIPLGGNKVSKTRVFINLWLVFLISGFWHGAQWNFIIWGIYHGLFLIIDKWFLLKLMANLPRIIKVVFSFVTVLIGWLIFRIEDINITWMFTKKLVDFTPGTFTFPLGQKFYFVLAVAFIWAFLPFFYKFEIIGENLLMVNHKFSFNIFKACFTIIFFVICLLELTTSEFNPFIYFRF